MHVIFTLILLLNLLSQIISQSSAIYGDGQDRYLVVQSDRLGLANRLRALADWYQIAKFTKRTLLLNWVPSVDCNISFLDMFVKGPSNFRVIGEPLIYSDTSRAVRVMAEENNLTFSNVIDDGEDFDFFIDETIVASEVNVVYTDYNGVVALRGVPCQQYLSLHSTFYSTLVPTSNVLEIVEEVMQHFEDRLMIGVHVRMHNPDFDWEIVPPGPGKFRASAFGVEDARVSDFKRQMSGIDKALGYSAGGTAAYKFFIASNDDAVKSHLMETYDNAVALQGGDLSRSTKDGMLVALVEWLLLSKSDLIIHTYASSFATEAAQVSRRPLVGLWGGVAVYHHDERLPYCGHMLYMRLGSKEGKFVEYEEGTHDNRKVQGKTLPLMPCQFMSGWGLQDLYCSMEGE